MRWLAAVFAGVLLLVLIARKASVSNSVEETVFEVKTAPLHAAPMCPWREPEKDLQLFFPGATEWKTEVRVLSGRRTELAKELNRALLPEENSLYLYRVYQGEKLRGTVLVRRVKGEHGSMELVLAVDPAARLCGLKVQRQREPETIASILESPDWLRRFSGQSARSEWQLASQLPLEARASGAAIEEGIKSELVLLAAAENETLQRKHH